MALKDLMGRTTTTPAAEPARPEPPPFAPTPSRAPAPAPAATTVLGPSSSLQGELRCSESLRIDGRVKGEVHCEQTLTVGEQGSVIAAIEGDTVVIAGEVQGDITARRKITLERTARVTGDLCTPGIVIQEGATLEGRIMIGGDAPEATQRPAERPAAAAPAAPRASEAPKPPRPPSASAPPAAP
jgi:cytoskeletal protein CcmA (bactofilin family)